ncbi:MULTISPECIES: hypothetical protein [Amniculibacterium]|jgi:hypothetical protein|uniref:hypothetical protein n=1 Tax=Amniculibacterium TaxID=2715289 RepID=UPI000F5B762B|nr:MULTISPECIES: hypothetical protein [Amniculibacterium]MBS1549375.1 hypothetical protein [Bacteroidota bacterium]
MEKFHKIIIVVSLLVLINIILQAYYFYQNKLGNEIADALMQAITFLANFNFITVLILPFLLMIYSIIAMVQKRKYGIILLLINICNCVLIFFT